MKWIKPEELRKGHIVRGEHGQRGDVIGVEPPGNEFDAACYVAWVNLPSGSTRMWGYFPWEEVELFSASEDAA
tara:strand:- start:516 stop:734 length:219 start_codon:yes stop_codon:yes gene_type:complete